MFEGKSMSGEKEQIHCWISSEGHLWMRGYFDTLPSAVRQRLRQSPFNICPACLVTKFAPKISKIKGSRQPERALFAAIEVMEAQVRKGTGNK
jgi:hypothetical protein